MTAENKNKTKWVSIKIPELMKNGLTEMSNKSNPKVSRHSLIIHAISLMLNNKTKTERKTK